MKNILVIAHAKERAIHFQKILESPDRKIKIWESFREPQPKFDYQAVILSGGPMSAFDLSISKNPNIQSEFIFLREVIESNIPILGVCLGHQILAKLLGGILMLNCKPQVGWFKINILNNNVLFNKIPKTFYEFKFHKDHVISLPSNCKILASSIRCKIEAFKHINKPIWGIQFHPEYGPEFLKKILKSEVNYLSKNNISLEKELKKTDKYYDVNLSNKFYDNFVDQV